MNIICQDIDGNLIKTLTQWDINQKIVIKNLSLTNTPEVHFCNSHSKLALVGEATYADGALTTEVPNILLQESLPITIYIYTTKDDGSAKTTYSIRVPVNPRPKPADYVYSDNAHFITYEELQAALAKSIEVIELATSAAKHAEQAAQTAEVLVEHNNSNFANAIKQTVSGNSILIDDASPIKHTLDVKTTANETVYVRGKNLIPFNNKAYYNGNYAAGQTYVINGVSFTVNDDGSVYASGTATGSAAFVLYRADAYKNGIHTVTFSGAPENASKTTYFLRLKTASESTANYEDYGNGITVGNVNLTGSTVSIIVLGGQSVDATFYPMLEFGTTASEFISPEETQSAIADENGIVSGIELRKITSIFTETSAEIECTYNRDTAKVVENTKEVIKKELDGIKTDIAKLGYRLINTATVEEDVQIVSFTTDLLGNELKNLNLSKIFILFTGSFVNTTSSQPLCMRFNGGGVYQMYKGFKITADTYYGFWLESETIISLTDRRVYKSTYPSILLQNFLPSSGMAQGLSNNNVALNSDIAVQPKYDISKVDFGCFNSNNLIKAGSTIYLFGV